LNGLASRWSFSARIRRTTSFAGLGIVDPLFSMPRASHLCCWLSLHSFRDAWLLHVSLLLSLACMGWTRSWISCVVLHLIIIVKSSGNITLEFPLCFNVKHS
jgi:hypothetical protein